MMHKQKNMMSRDIETFPVEIAQRVISRLSLSCDKVWSSESRQGYYRDELSCDSPQKNLKKERYANGHETVGVNQDQYNIRTLLYCGSP